MNAFLVLVACRFSDHPLALFETLEAATVFAEGIEPAGSDRPRVAQKPGFISLGPPGLNSTPIAVFVIPFLAGFPQERIAVKCFVSKPKKPVEEVKP